MTKLSDLEKKFSVRSTDDFNAISLSRQKLLDKLEKTREDNLTEMNLYISGAKKPTFDTIEKLDERYNSIKNKIDSEFESLLLAKYGTLLGLTKDKWSLESIESEFSRIMKSENKTDIDFLVLKHTIRSNQSDFKSAIEFLKTLAEKKETKQFIKDLDKIKESGVTQNSAAATPLTPREAAVNPSLLVSEIPPLSVLENKFQVMSNDNFETIKSKRQIFLDNLEQQRKSYLLEMNNYILGDTKPTFNSIERLEKEFNSAKNEIDSKYKSLLLAKYGTLLGLTKDKWSLESIESEFSRIMKSENKTDIDFLVLKQTIRSNQSDFKSAIEFLKTLAEKKETEQFLQDLDKAKETSDEAAANMTQTTPTSPTVDNKKKVHFPDTKPATPVIGQQASKQIESDSFDTRNLSTPTQAVTPSITKPSLTIKSSNQSTESPSVEKERVHFNDTNKMRNQDGVGVSTKINKVEHPATGLQMQSASNDTPPQQASTNRDSTVPESNQSNNSSTSTQAGAYSNSSSSSASKDNHSQGAGSEKSEASGLKGIVDKFKKIKRILTGKNEKMKLNNQDNTNPSKPLEFQEFSSICTTIRDEISRMAIPKGWSYDLGDAQKKPNGIGEFKIKLRGPNDTSRTENEITVYSNGKVSADVVGLSNDEIKHFAKVLFTAYIKNENNTIDKLIITGPVDSEPGKQIQIEIKKLIEIEKLKEVDLQQNTQKPVGLGN